MTFFVEFKEFPKMPRLSRECIITEKIDGTNASIYIGEYGSFRAGSRTRWITPEDDNFGFAKWAYEHRDELMGLGVGHHFGEWWGQGIQRKYGMDAKRFSLFNVSRWYSAADCDGEDLTDRTAVPACCSVVPILLRGPFDTAAIEASLQLLAERGSYAAPGFMNPEGVIIYHVAAGIGFKKTLGSDGHKGVKQ